MISIIVPSYNSEKFLDNCINSLIAQSYNNFEVIVVNDGSNDGTESKVNSYVEKYDNIRLITQANQGVSAARNTGIENAKGEFILFLDSDDYIDDGMLEELMRHIEKYNPDLVCCEILDQNSSEIAKNVFSSNESFCCNTRDEIGRRLFFIRTGSAVGKLYRKSIIEKYNLRFKIGVNLAEDFIFVHEYCMHCDSMSKNINAKYIVNNINAESLSKSYLENIENIMIMQNDVLKSAFVFFPEYEIEYYKHSVDIDVKACFFIFKNFCLRGCKLKTKEIRKYLKASSFISETFIKLPLTDAKKLPKMKNDYIQYKILCTKNVDFILFAFTFLEKVKFLNNRLKRMVRG